MQSNSVGVQSFLRSCSRSAFQEISLFMEPESSLACSQEPPLFPALRHMNPVHIFPPYFFKIYSNIIFPSTPWSSSDFSLQVFQLKFYMYLSSLACYMNSHPPCFDCPDNISWWAQVLKLFIMHFSPTSCHFLIGSNILLSVLFWSTLNLCSSCRGETPSFSPL